MSGKSSPGFLAGLIVEGAVIGLVVTLLPKVPLGDSTASPRDELADERPSVVPHRLPVPGPNWRTAVSRPETPAELPPADPAYVERRLDEAGQQLLSGVTTYLSRHAREVLQPRAQPDASLPPNYTAPSFSPPANAFRY